MDLILLIGIATALLTIIISLWLFKSKKEKVSPTDQPTAVRRPAAPVRIQHDVPVRAQIARNQRNRARTAAAAAEPPASHRQVTTTADVDQAVAEHSDDEDDGAASRLDGSGAKIGAKKRAKIEAKAEKKARQEVEQQLREEKRKRDELDDQDRAKQEELERDEERKREEAERLARELKEKQEYEEYLKLKAAFSVEEEGYDETESASTDMVLQAFLEYIRTKKVVILEELAKEFKLKTQAAIDRIHELKANGQITGVVDDRGKFIYISEDELRAVAKFIRQRGRISISELVESSNDLINLTPVEVKWKKKSVYVCKMLFVRCI